MLTGNLEDSFKISLLGARNINKIRTANKVMKGISGIDDQSIINAIKLSEFDVLYRAGPKSKYYVDFEDTIISVEEHGTEFFANDLSSYKEKVENYIKISVEDDEVLQKIYRNEVLSQDDISSLEKILWQDLGTR